MMGTPNSEAELKEIVASIHLERSQRTEPLFQRKYRLPIFLAISIGMFNQLAGINAILYYANDIFAFGGFSRPLRGQASGAAGRDELLRDPSRHVRHR